MTDHNPEKSGQKNPSPDDRAARRERDEHMPGSPAQPLGADSPHLAGGPPRAEGPPRADGMSRADEPPRTGEPREAADDLDQEAYGYGQRDRGSARHAALIAVAGLAAGLAIALVLTLGSGSSPQAADARSIAGLLAGIPQHGNVLGDQKAPVTIEFFGDLECPTTRGFVLKGLPSIIRQWVRTGKARIEYRSVRTISKPKPFGIQQVAALAAGEQDKLWYYIEYFYHEQGREHSDYVTEGYLGHLAGQVAGLNRKLWASDRHSPSLAAQVSEDEQVAAAAHLDNTPSFLIGRTGSAPASTLGQRATLEDIDKAIQRALHSPSGRDGGAGSRS